jgi:hypothetical protein
MAGYGGRRWKHGRFQPSMRPFSTIPMSSVRAGCDGDATAGQRAVASYAVESVIPLSRIVSLRRTVWRASSTGSLASAIRLQTAFCTLQVSRWRGVADTSSQSPHGEKLAGRLGPNCKRVVRVLPCLLRVPAWAAVPANRGTSPEVLAYTTYLSRAWS